MKKMLTLLLMLIVSMGAWADSHWTVDSKYAIGQQGPERIVNATFVTNETYYQGANATVYEIGAFIDGECRHVARPAYDVPPGSGRINVQLRVPGNIDGADDEGKAITFKAYNERTGCEYNLTSSVAVTWLPDDEAAATPTLTLTAATGVTLEKFELNVGETVDLTTHMTVVPEGATLPNNVAITWSLGNYASMGTISGNNLTATTPGSGLYHMTAPFESSEVGFDVFAPATAIAINPPTSYTLRIGNDADVALLNEILAVGPNNPHYTVTPANTTDEVVWSFDTDYIGIGETGGYTLLQPGTTELSLTVQRNGEDVLMPSNPSSITLTIVQPVTGIALAWKGASAFKANVGDDIHSRLASLVEITPQTATNQEYSFNVKLPTGGPAAAGVATIGTGSLVFNQAGSYLVEVVSADNNAITGTLAVEIENPAKDVTLGATVLNFDSNASVADITAAINANITLTPDGYTSASGTAAVTEGSAIVLGGTIDAVEVQNKNEGSATVTVTVQWNDYSSYDGSVESITTQSATAKSFTVNIGLGLQGFNVVHTPAENVLTLTPIPANAIYTPEEVNVTLTSQAGYPEEWEVVTVKPAYEGNTIRIVYQAELPGLVSVAAGNYPLYDATAVGADAAVRFTQFDVPATFEFAQGWQWRSNYWKDAANDTFDEFFSGSFLTNLAEARTQTQLLFNDATWGLYGGIATQGLGRNDCYKLLMKAAATTEMGAATFQANSYVVSLNKGWTWIACPYVYNRLITNALTGMSLPDNTFIIAKTGGAAGWSNANGGSWTGDLSLLEHGQGYLVYCPEAGYRLGFANESNMTQGDEGTVPVGPTPEAGARSTGKLQKVWQYDHSLFANNMTMIAQLKGVDHVSDYTVGAFVGGECRGEGRIIEGRAFITVHGKNGETVSFRLHNELTGEMLDVAETVKSQQLLGSLTAPVTLTAVGGTTGISQTAAASASQPVESYDLQGRKSTSGRLLIQRMADGTVRKVKK